MRSAGRLWPLALILSCGVQAQSPTLDTYADYLKAQSQVRCEASLRCCGTLCDPDADAAFYQGSARTLDYIGNDLLGYDRQAAMDCLTGMRQHYSMCDGAVNAQPLPQACDHVLIPKSPVGGMCETGVPACVPTSTCIQGACVASLQVGQTCQIGGSPSCVSGSYCNTSKGVPYTCTLNAAVGQPCAGAICVAGAYCSGTIAPPTCVAYGQSGQPCSMTKPCDPAAGLICTPQGTCQPPPIAQTVREQLCMLH